MREGNRDTRPQIYKSIETEMLHTPRFGNKDPRTWAHAEEHTKSENQSTNLYTQRSSGNNVGMQMPKL